MTNDFLGQDIKNVAIIGGGPGGIAALRAIIKEESFETITVYERGPEVGGTWVYSPEVDLPPKIPSTNALESDETLSVDGKLNSPIYNGLRANLPKSVMSFFDVPFDEDVPLYARHEDVLNYLKKIVTSENLTRFFKFSTRVDRLERCRGGWAISATDLTTGKDVLKYYDAVVVATGHYSVPYIPDIPGLTELNENIKVMHSRDYRDPQKFKNKTVLVIGGGSSGLDIVRETSSVAQKVYQCIRSENEMSCLATKKDNIEQVGLVKKFSCAKNTCSIECKDGKKFKSIDVVIFSTGFFYSFPFIPFQKDHLIFSGHKVHNLIEHMFYKENTTLCFLGLPIKVAPFPLMQRQATAMARYWAGKIPMYGFRDRSHDNDLKTDMTFDVEMEVDYHHLLGSWSDGWTDNTYSEWESRDPINGELTPKWIELRTNAFKLRKASLGY
ncbi:hypothetical protein BY458DRAFT_537883 [Sporodiniella umbellata]|nr:hypothetical protein BY458DRAFT_537883 [Sporodiniella umbellata]